jgi:hypothetical protein
MITHTWPILPVLAVVVVLPVLVAVGVGAGDEIEPPTGVAEATVTGDVVLPETGAGAGVEPIVAPPLHAESAASAKAIAIQREKPDESMEPQKAGNDKLSRTGAPTA